AKRVKQAGLRLRMADGAGVLACRMYRDWPTVRDGFAKNIIAGHHDSLLLLAASTAFHWSLFLAPWLWLFAPAIGPTTGPTTGLVADGLGWPAGPLLVLALGFGLRLQSAAGTSQRLTDAATLPLGVLLMTAVAARAVWWRCTGGPVWKGRRATVLP
ncbi:MAG: hypothetical protein ACRC1K_02725, partial [Planctomycetia bacterium]